MNIMSGMIALSGALGGALVTFVLFCALEVFLARREAAWPGLVLPGLGLLCSLIVVLSYAAFAGQTMVQIIGGMLVAFLLSNIPTLILLAIYFACRGAHRRRKELEKMNVQDL